MMNIDQSVATQYWAATDDTCGEVEQPIVFEPNSVCWFQTSVDLIFITNDIDPTAAGIGQGQRLATLP